MKARFLKGGLTTWLFSAISLLAVSQEIPSQYLQEAFDKNLVLQQKKISLEKSLLALKEARSLFYPTTWFEGQYLLAQGGRSIDIPVGDLLNPVYATLNQLTGTNKFPTVSNASEQLNPNNFYDFRVKTTMPLYNNEIRINKKIKEEQIQWQQTEIDTYKRELVKEVKTAYFRLLLADEATHIYENALTLVQQNLRVNQSLMANGKGLPAYISRAESEVKSVESQLQNARNDVLNARAYFNFLLNRSLTDSVILRSSDYASAATLPPADYTISNREELASLRIAGQINNHLLKMNKEFRKPKVNLFLDLAAQGFDFSVNKRTPFYLGGVQVQIPLYAGKRNLYKIEQSQLDITSLQSNTTNVEHQLELSALVSRNNVNNALSSYQSALKQSESARQYFRLIDKGYTEGVNSYIEWLDARTQLTNSQIQVNLNQFRLLSAQADFERQTASFNLKS